MKTLKRFSLVCMLIYGLASCRTGYGCHGRESWNHMTRRINSPN